MRLRIELARRQVRPGEEVTGVVTVLDGGAARSVDAWLFFVEEVGREAATARHVGPQRLCEGDVEAGRALPFALSLPADALPNHEDEFGRLGWDLVVKVDRRRRRDVVEEAELDVALAPPS